MQSDRCALIDQVNEALKTFHWGESGFPGEEHGRGNPRQSFDKGENTGAHPQNSQEHDNSGVLETAYRKEMQAFQLRLC